MDALSPAPAAPDFAALKKRLPEAMAADRSGLSKLLETTARMAQRGQPFDRNLHRFTEWLEKSITARKDRMARRPVIHYDNELPIMQRREEFLELLSQHSVIIVCGETGSGKSTQLPKFCLEAQRGIDGLIGHTQPRRIAARSVAMRLSEELRAPLGQAVGYKVRFQEAVGAESYIKLMTDGILLAEIQSDPHLRRYDTIIIDEAHERSLNIDFLLGYLKRLLTQRKDLKVIITSATIDAERFSQHFAVDGKPAPIIEASGRSYPVEILYRPILSKGDAAEDNDIDMQQAIVEAVQEATSQGFGDILVFLPTEREIHETAKILRGGERAASHREILPLYARLSAAEQQRVFQVSQSQRRIILATNVAESSLTVPGIRYVIDTGTVRLSRYSPRSKIQRLPIEPVSQASANQRAGRCGRVGPGICYRLYDEADFAARDPFTVPEILRTNLAQVILKTESLGLGSLSSFPFLDPPRTESIRDGYRTLFELGAVDLDNRLTELGKKLSRIPTDPRIARVLFAADEQLCLAEMLIIASALETQDVRERPVGKQDAADEAHAKFLDETSDFVTYLKIWDFYHELKAKLSHSQLKKACSQNYLSLTRLREWSDLHRELSELVRAAGLKIRPRLQDTSAIHRAILAGFPTNIAMKTDSGEYQMGGGALGVIWPGSGMAKQKPRWIVAAEFVETTRRFLRIAGKIESEWVEPYVEHLVNRTYHDPHWDARSRSVVAYEKVSLQGLPIVNRRKTQFGRVNAAQAQEIFIRQALVEGDYPNPPAFLAHNLALRQELEDLQARLRKTSLIADPETQAKFYAQRLPPDIYDGPRLDKWLRIATKDSPDLLKMTREDLLAQEADEDWRERFPDQIRVGSLQAEVEYHLEPGTAQDGITIKVPQAAFRQLEWQRLGWLVPGLLEEKIVALLRGLPKEYRVTLSPIPESVKQILPLLKMGQGSLVDQLADIVRSRFGARVLPAMFDESKLPNHLRMNIRLIDNSGQEVLSSREQTQLEAHAGQLIPSELISKSMERTGLKTWDFATVHEKVIVRQNGLEIDGFPATVDEGKTVGLKLFDTAIRALHEHKRGVRRLAVLKLQKELSMQVTHLPEIKRWELAAKALPQPFPLKEHLIDLLAMRAVCEGKVLPRSPEQFQLAIDAGFDELGNAVTEVMRLMSSIFQQTAEIRVRLDRFPPVHDLTKRDLQRQYQWLLTTGFLTQTPWFWLAQFPKYLKAMLLRMDRLTGNAAKDRDRIMNLEPWIVRYAQRWNEHKRRKFVDVELETFRWMIEEYRIHLFVQEMATAVPVSDKRLEKQWLATTP
ncbi:ATP-dependent RNA helicase HrpB [Planctopirus ephydatiae]|uniref:ATP-dependent RNA helicase HrpB n=1 Tax=Planctopirus ephydatiae TaxID=2528019 RepID=A0A518GNN6_9PLAN|nr:ATP-dependent RNA helicase HrpA [Planctopirus ephydatiae]QDV30154.1 ATP-dependent RNA helicase HrpB [Planctopirus ephydatiae]